MDTINNAWGLPMAILALLAVLAIFGTALWFILTAMETNRKFRWFQLVGRRYRRERSDTVAKAKRK